MAKAGVFLQVVPRVTAEVVEPTAGGRPSQQPLLLTPTASTRHFSLQYDNGDRNMAFQLKGFGPQLEISNQIQHTMRKPDIEALNPAALLLHMRRPNFVPLVDSSWNPRGHDISEG